MNHTITIKAPNGVSIEIKDIPPTWSRKDTFQFLADLFHNLQKTKNGK